MLRKLAFLLAFLVLLATAAAVAVRLWLQSDALRATLERQASLALGQPVALGSAAATLIPRLGLHLTDVRVGEPTVADIDDISIATGLDLLFSREIRNADLRLQGGFLNPAMLAGMGAAAASDAQAQSSSRSGVVVSSLRSIQVQDVELRAGSERVLLDAEASIDGNGIALQRATLRIRDTTTRITGTIRTRPVVEGNLTVTADTLPADVFLAALSTSSGNTGPTPARTTSAPYHLALTLEANALSVGETLLRQIGAHVDATPERVAIEPLAFTVHDGTFRGNATLQTSTRERPVLNLKGSFSAIDITHLQAPSANATTGRLEAGVDLNASVESVSASWLQALNGSVELHLHDGRMPGVGVIKRSVIRFAGRATAPQDLSTSDAYDRVDARLNLAGGSAAISDLILETPDFTATGDGRFGLLDSTVALRVNVVLSEALSQKAGRDLYRYAREGNRVVLPAIVGGTLQEPTATIDIGNAARRALENRIEDEAKSALDRLLRRR